MRFASLGSGSQGNALIVEAGRTRLMLDCGFPLRETVSRLARAGARVQLRSRIAGERPLSADAEGPHRQPPRAPGQSILGIAARRARPRPAQTPDRGASVADEQHARAGAGRACGGAALRARVDFRGDPGRGFRLAGSVGDPYSPVVFADTAGTEDSQISSNRSSIGWHSF